MGNIDIKSQWSDTVLVSQGIKCIITKTVCLSYRDQLHWKTDRIKPVVAIFKIKEYENGYMAYVECERLNKAREKKNMRGNSLRKLWKMSKKKLLQKIESYEWLDQIIKDFDC